MTTREVGNLRTKLSWEDQGATRSLEGFKQDLKGLRSEMNLARSRGRDYTNSLKGLREQSDILTRRFQTQQEKVRELRRRYEESVKVKGEDAKQTQNLLAEYNNATAQMNRTEEQLKRVNSAIEEQINPWKRLGREMDAAGKRTQEIGRNMTDFGKNYTTRVTAPIVAGGAAVFKASMDFESAFAGVEKTVEGTEKQLATVRQEIRDMAKDIPATTEQIAAVAESAGQLGIATENVTDFTKTMINLGEATNMTSEQAATEFARFANIVGMSQDDFDKLGSTIVALGNNLATTESEISSMAMRLAGAGAQIGLTEPQILAFASALSSVGIEAEAGGSAFSKVMVEMQLAAETGGDSLHNFAKVAGMSANEFKKAYEQDATGAIIAFIEGLSTAEDRGLSAIGILDDMGIKEVRLRDTLLRAAGATEVFNNAIEIGSDAWKENTALTEEAEKRYATTESQLRIMWNRIKDVAISLGDALVPAVMDAIDVAEPFIQKLEDGAEAFAEMDEEQQRNILKLIALAAAIGPVSVGLGGMTTTIGGLIRIGGSFSSLLGRAKGSGLIGKIGLLGMGGPVGLAVAGVTTLGGVLYTLHKNSQKSTEEVLNSIQTRKEEINTLDELIGQYETLQNKNKLSTDEMLRYMDIATELRDAKTEEAIKKLKDEQAELLGKSALTNDEMDRFLELNKKIVDETPSATTAISEQGNAYAENLNHLKELNELERQRLTDETYATITDELDNQKKNLEQQKALQEEIKQLENERINEQGNLTDLYARMRDLDLEIAEAKREKVGLSGEELVKAQERYDLLLIEKTELQGAIELQSSKVSGIDNEITKKQESLSTTNDELEAFQTMIDEYEALILAEVDLTTERGLGVQELNKQIVSLQNQKEKLSELLGQGKITTFEYQEQKKVLDEQTNKLTEAKNRLKDINSLAGSDVYEVRNSQLSTQVFKLDEVKKRANDINYVLGKKVEKDLNINPDPSISQLDKDLGRGVSKTLTIEQVRKNATNMLDPDRNADGTNYFNHPSGLSWLGEKGTELVRHGNSWTMADFGLYNVPRGAQIFTHDETKKILNSLNNIPGYANGASPAGEADRIASRLNQSQQLQGEAVIYTTVINQMDSREIGRHTHKSVTEFQNRSEFIKNKFRG